MRSAAVCLEVFYFKVIHVVKVHVDGNVHRKICQVVHDRPLGVDIVVVFLLDRLEHIHRVAGSILGVFFYESLKLVQMGLLTTFI